MDSYSDWKEAHGAAVALAREIGREVGILRVKEYNKVVFQVMRIPGPKFRFGIDAQCEVVSPSDPL